MPYDETWEALHAEILARARTAATEQWVAAAGVAPTDAGPSNQPPREGQYAGSVSSDSPSGSDVDSIFEIDPELLDDEELNEILDDDRFDPTLQN